MKRDWIIGSVIATIATIGSPMVTPSHGEIVATTTVKEAPAKKDDKNKPEEKKPAEKVEGAKPAEGKQAEEKKKPDEEPADAVGAVEVVVDAAVAIEDEVIVMQEDGNGNNWDAMRKQFLQQFRPMLNGQLHLARAVCEPTPEQFEQLKIDGELALRAATKKCVEVQKKMQQGGFNFGRDPYPDPNSDIADGVADAVKKRLPADKAAKYQEEVDKRRAHIKRVGVLNLVSKLDRDLVLSREQRERLATVLSENWKQEWGRNLQMYMQDDYNQYPALPEAPIADLLTPSQAKVFKAMPKHNVMYWGWGSFVGGVGMIDVGPVPKVDDPDEPKKGAKKPDGDKQAGPRAVRGIIGAAVAVPAAKVEVVEAKAEAKAEAKPAEKAAPEKEVSGKEAPKDDAPAKKEPSKS